MVEKLSMEERINELTLLLIYLQSWKEKAFDTNKAKDVDVLRAWKGYDFNVLDRLDEQCFAFKMNRNYLASLFGFVTSRLSGEKDDMYDK